MNFKEQLMPFIHEIRCGYIQYINRRDDLKLNHTKEDLDLFLETCDFEYDTLGIELIPVKFGIIWLYNGWLTFEDRSNGAICNYIWHYNKAPTVPDFLINYYDNERD